MERVDILQRATAIAPDALGQEAQSLRDRLRPHTAIIHSAINVGFALVTGVGLGVVLRENPVTFAVPGLIGLTSGDLLKAWKGSRRLGQIGKYGTAPTSQ